MFHPSFRDIFKSSLEDACESRKYKISNEIKEYLMSLCVDDLLKTASSKPSGLLDSFILLDTIPSNKHSLEYLKLNGDYHLSIAGYVPEALCNKYVEFDYYISLGRYSYYRLHQRLPRESVYKTLAYDYLDIVYVLNETFDTIKVCDDAHLLGIWEAWKETRHPIFKKKLIRLGLNPDEVLS